jgi:hypothetical protein
MTVRRALVAGTTRATQSLGYVFKQMAPTIKQPHHIADGQR